MKNLKKELLRGLRAFRHFNRYKQEMMLNNDPVGGKAVLDIIPLFLHINHPEFPGYVNGGQCPGGIKIMEWPSGALGIIEPILARRIQNRNLKDYIPRHREIEGVFTIGSVGSIGQTKDSDYDIWIVIDEKSIGRDRVKLLESKLRFLRRWIVNRFLIDIHFFLMDVDHVRKNAFGKVSQEGSGSALKTLLKEEFYRTMTLVEGRIPLWWIVPPFTDDPGYKACLDLTRSTPGLTPDDFIDLGNITVIPERELLGAALWQMHKALDDPFKSVLKMALVSTYMDATYTAQLLCDVLKQRILNAGPGDMVDPYVVAFNRIEEFYGRSTDKKVVDLLRRCFYLKVNPGIKDMDLIRMGKNDKALIMVQVLKGWGWSLNVLKDLNMFSNWDVSRYRAFGDEIHEYLKATAAQLIRRAKKSLLGSSIDEDVEMEVLRRRVEAFYVAKENKILPERRVQRIEPAYRELFFMYDMAKWKIFSCPPRDKGKEARSPIIESERVVPIVAWLVYNRRFDPSTAFHMVPNTTHVVLSDIQSLLIELREGIPDVYRLGLNRDALMVSSSIERVWIIPNMEASKEIHRVEEIDIIYSNTWNELFSLHMQPRDLKSWLAQVKRDNKAVEIKIWLPQAEDSKQLAKSLVSLIV